MFRGRRSGVLLCLLVLVAPILAVGCGGATRQMGGPSRPAVSLSHAVPDGTVIVQQKRQPGPSLVVVAGHPYRVAGDSAVGHDRVDLGGRLELGRRAWPGPVIATSAEEASALTWFTAGCPNGGYLVVFGRVGHAGDRVLVRSRNGTRDLSNASFPVPLRTAGAVAYGVVPYGPAVIIVRDRSGRSLLVRDVSLPTSCVETAGNARAR